MAYTRYTTNVIILHHNNDYIPTILGKGRLRCPSSRHSENILDQKSKKSAINNVIAARVLHLVDGSSVPTVQNERVETLPRGRLRRVGKISHGAVVITYRARQHFLRR